MRTRPLHAYPFTPSHRCSSSVLASDSDLWSSFLDNYLFLLELGVWKDHVVRTPLTNNLFLFLLPNPLLSVYWWLNYLFFQILTLSLLALRQPLCRLKRPSASWLTAMSVDGCRQCSVAMASVCLGPTRTGSVLIPHHKSSDVRLSVCKLCIACLFLTFVCETVSHPCRQHALESIVPRLEVESTLIFNSFALTHVFGT